MVDVYIYSIIIMHSYYLSIHIYTNTFIYTHKQTNTHKHIIHTEKDKIFKKIFNLIIYVPEKLFNKVRFHILDEGKGMF